MQPSISFSDYQQQLQAFWSRENRLCEQRLSNPLLFELARNSVDSEEHQQVPMRNRKTFELALKEADAVVRKVRSEQARKGGQAKKQDQLQDQIDKLVARKPDMTTSELLTQLRSLAAPGSIIDEIDDERIWFVTPTDGLKDVPISGLKDRLSRAKKKISR